MIIPRTNFHQRSQKIDIVKYIENLKREFVDGLTERILILEADFLDLEKRYEQTLMDKVLREVHSIKGAGGTYGIPAMTVICNQLEDRMQATFTDGANKIDAGEILPFLDTIQSILALHQNTEIDVETRGIKEKAFVEHLSKLRTATSVFYLDNSRTTRTVLAPFLERKDVKVSQSDDGYIALGRIVHENYDLVVTANNVKTLPGRGVVSAARAVPHLKKLPFIFIGSAPGEVFPEDMQPVYYFERTPDLAAKLNTILEKLNLTKRALPKPA